jgi:hypothetical protein
MPKGPQGQKRPADVIGNAVHVMRIATGEIEENNRASEGKEYTRKGGLKGGKARAASMTPERRAEIAKKAAKTRWNKSTPLK